MVEYIRGIRFKSIQGKLHAPTKIRHQGFDFYSGHGSAHDANAFSKMPCATITQIITVHRGDDNIAKSHQGDGFGQLLWLFFIQGIWTPVCDIAKGATTCAQVPHDHESRGTVTETLTQVRAGCFFADGMQIVFTDQGLEFLHARIGRCFCADPFRFARQGAFGRNHLDRYARGF